MAREAGLNAAANIKLRLLLSRNKSFDCTDVKIGVAALSYKAGSRKRAPCRRGPAEILDIDVTGAPATFQNQTFKVARYRVAEGMESQDMAEVECNPASGTSDTGDEARSADRGKTQKAAGLPLEEEGGPTASRVLGRK